MTFRELARGIEILDGYSDVDACVDTEAERLLVESAPPGSMDERDSDELFELGWLWSEGGRAWVHAT